MRKLVFGFILIVSAATAKERPYLPLADLDTHSSCVTALGAEDRGDRESIDKVNEYVIRQLIRLENEHPDHPHVIDYWLTNPMVDRRFLPKLVMFYCRDSPQKTIFSALSATYQWLVNYRR